MESTYRELKVSKSKLYSAFEDVKGHGGVGRKNIYLKM